MHRCFLKWVAAEHTIFLNGTSAAVDSIEHNTTILRSLHLTWRLCEKRDVGAGMCARAVLRSLQVTPVRRVAGEHVIPYQRVVAPPSILVAFNRTLCDQVVSGAIATQASERECILIVPERVANDPVVLRGVTPDLCRPVL